MNWERELIVSKEAAMEAGKAIMEVYHSENVHVEYKDDRSPLTEADRRANQIIVDRLSK